MKDIEDLESEYFYKGSGKMKKNKKKNKRLKKTNIILLIISIIWLILIALNTYLILKYDVLPFKYLIIYLIVFLLLPIILIITSLRKKKKVLKIFVSIIGVISIIILNLTFFYLNKTFNFLDEFTSNYNYETKNYLVLVLKSSNYTKLSDLKNETIGYVDQTNEYNKALKKLEENIQIKEKEYKNYDIMLSDINSSLIASILINDAYYQMLIDEIDDFSDNYQVIYEFSLTSKTEEIKKDVNVLEDTFNIYISGIDSYGNVNSLTRSDVNIVVTINPKTKQILMTNIPRDYYVLFPGTDQKDKLTHAGIYGLDMSVSAIQELLDIEINYYFKVNYNALIKLVDALDGVDVYSKYTFTSGALYYKYYKGYNHVNGEQALEFVRTRKAFQDGDRVRGENQQAMIQAIIKKAISGTILTRYGTILDSLKGSFTTNMGTDKITDLIKMQLDDMSSWNITSVSLSGSDASMYTYTYPSQKLYVMLPDEDTITNAKDKIALVEKGEKLENTYQENNGVVNSPVINKPIEPEEEKEENLENKEEIINNNEENSENMEEITDNTLENSENSTN